MLIMIISRVLFEVAESMPMMPTFVDRYIEVVQANTDVTGPFETTEFEYSRNSMAGAYDFRALEGRLIKIKEALLEEHASWIRQGEAATVKGAHSYDCQQIQLALQVRV